MTNIIGPWENAEMGLRDYQIKLKDDIYNAWGEDYKNVLAVMPTGLGKTRLFCNIAVTEASKGLPTAIEVHRKELVQQICLTLAELGIAHNIIAPRPTIMGIVAAERRLYGQQFYDYKAAVTVVSVDTLNSRINRHMSWANSIKLWIVDEAAHVLKDNKWGKSLKFFPNARGLGVTATPQRLDKRGLGSHVDGVFDVMVQGPNTRWGIENKFLSDYKVIISQSDYNQHLKKASEGHDFTRKAMAQASAKSQIVGDVVKNYEKFSMGKQAIVFADSITAGERMEAKFLKQGITAKLLTGATDDKERLEGLINFRELRTQVLINVDLFDEGLDVPGIETIIMARPTMSISKFLQMIGRGLRPAPNKPHALIIDHVGNIMNHGLPDSHRRWTLDRIAKRRDKVNLTRICQNEMCNAPYDRLLHVCPYCGLEDVPKRSGESGGRTPLDQVDGDLVLLDPAILRALERNTILEDPLVRGERVGKKAGAPAGIKAMKDQRARIETQKELVELIALWAGKMRHYGMTDRMIHKHFYIHKGMTITQSLSEPLSDMLKTIKGLKDEI